MLPLGRLWCLFALTSGLLVACQRKETRRLQAETTALREKAERLETSLAACTTRLEATQREVAVLQETPDALLSRAADATRRSNYTEAVGLLQKLVERHPKSPLVPEAMNRKRLAERQAGEMALKIKEAAAAQERREQDERLAAALRGRETRVVPNRLLAFEVRKRSVNENTFAPPLNEIVFINRSPSKCTNAKVIVGKYYSAFLDKTMSCCPIARNPADVAVGAEIVISVIDRAASEAPFADSTGRKLAKHLPGDIRIECDEGHYE